MPRASPPSVSAEATHAAEDTAPADRNVAVVSHAQYIPTLTVRLPNALTPTPRWVKWPGDLDL